MTREEVIEKLNEAIKFAYSEADAGVCRMAIAALREQETVTKCHDTDGCEYCRESENIYYHAGEVNALDELLYITGDDLVVDIGCRFYLAASIKFCPMCGRRLEEV